MATPANQFVEELHAYMREQEKAPLYGKSFFEGVMAGTMDRAALKKWAIQHHYRTGQHIRAFGGIFLNTRFWPLGPKNPPHLPEEPNYEKEGKGGGGEAPLGRAPP